MLTHELPEFVGLRAQLRIELVAHGKDLGRIAHGLGIAGLEGQGVVRKVHGEILALHLGLGDIELLGHGDQITLDGDAELLHILRAVAVALHTQVAQLGIAVIAQLAAHAVAQLHQLVIDLIQLGAVFVVPVALGHPGSLADLVIGIQLPGRELAEGVHFAPEGDLGGGDQLGIAAAQGILLLQVLHDLGREGLGGHLGIDEGDAAVLGFQLLAEGGVQSGSGPGLEGGLEGRHLLLVEGVLGVIEFVAGVDVPADGGQGDHGVVFSGGQFGFPVDGVSLFEGLGSQEAAGAVLDLGLPGSQVRAPVGDLRESHGKTLLPKYLPTV